MRLAALAATAVMITTSFAAADTVQSKEQFIQLMQGKTLKRAPQIRLQVKPDGRIQGRAVSWDVTGTWSWQDGYFCRNLDWGGMDIGYNCQEVRLEGNRVRFTSDRGNGDSAAFRLN